MRTPAEKPDKDALALDAARAVMKMLGEQPIIGWRPVQVTAKVQCIIRQALDQAEEVKNEDVAERTPTT